MPQYAALIYGRDADWTSPDEADVTKAYMEFGEEAAPVLRGGAALFPTATATTVRVKGGRGGEVVTSDGPYLETKEVLGGFWVIDAPDLDVALKLAAEGSKACRGKVEVRPFDGLA